MKLYDISLTLSARSIRWVTAQPLELIERKRMRRGDTNNSSSVHTSVHAGTHVDAPFHFVPDGITIESLPLETFIGPARVCAVDAGSHITASDVERAQLAGETRVLFKTRNSNLLKKGEYDAAFAPFSVDAAEALVNLGVKLVGLDYLSAAAADEQVPVHRAFLDHGVILLEGVELSEVPPGRYELFCPPVKLAGSDGAPCRAVLRELS
ncbi:MAG TPA: cyclase family protein [Candidatus Limnocylindrales bacterium]|nr:cyclase family protein [Candidatus Limnocylindrales bacterium]